MDRSSLVMKAEIAQATGDYVNRIQAIRARHGFGRLELELSNTDSGAKVSVDIEVDIRMQFDKDGRLEMPEEFEIRNINGPPKPTPEPSQGTPIRKSEYEPPPASTRPASLEPATEDIPRTGPFA